MSNRKISYKYINDYSTLIDEAESLSKEKSIGVDLEADSLFHFKEKVCLLQISTNEKNLLIDPLALKDLSPLVPIFSNPGIQKIFHGSDYDIRSLYRDFGIEVHSLFDTHLAAKILGSSETGLASLLNEHFNVTLEKKYQKKDWSKRPLPDEMLTYGVYDTLYLIPLRRILEERLIKKDRYDWFNEECESLSRVRFANPNGDPLFYKFKGARKLAPRSLAILEAILKLRQNMALKKDRPPFKVLRNDQILSIVNEEPSEINELSTLSSGQKQIMGMNILDKIKEAMMLPELELPKYPKQESTLFKSSVNRNIKEIKNWRNKVAGKLDIDVSMICTNAQIQLLAQTLPVDIPQLRKLDVLRNWQVDLYGNDICEIFSSMS